MNRKSTQLSKQLESVRTEDVYASEFSEKHHTIIFDRKDAQGIDDEAVFNQAKEAFKSMVAIENQFSRFNETLFGPGWRDFSYIKLSEEEMKCVKEEVEEFLILLCPHLLITPAVRCLEWLVRFYKIHLYHSEFFLWSLMPNHDTNIFSRIVQLFNVKSLKPSYYWLQSIQKSRYSLSREVFLTHCIREKWSLVFDLCNFVLCISEYLSSHFTSQKFNSKVEIVKTNHSVVYSFYTSILIGVCDARKSKRHQESFMYGFYPFLVKGLRSNVRDYTISTILIISHMSSSISFTDKALRSLSCLIIKRYWTCEDADVYQSHHIQFKCLLHLIKTQNVNCFGEKFLSILLKKQIWTKIISSSLETLDYSTLIKVFVNTFTSYTEKCFTPNEANQGNVQENAIETYWDDISMFFLNSIECSCSQELVISYVIRGLLKIAKILLLQNDSSMLEKVTSVLSQIEKRKSNRFGVEFSEYLSDLNHSSDEKDISKRLFVTISQNISKTSLNHSFTSAAESVESCQALSTSKHEYQLSHILLTVSSYHPETEIRRRSSISFVEYLLNYLHESESVASPEYNKPSVANLLLSFLNDDQPEVVSTFLSSLSHGLESKSTDKLADLSPPDSILPILNSILTKVEMSKMCLDGVYLEGFRKNLLRTHSFFDLKSLMSVPLKMDSTLLLDAFTLKCISLYLWTNLENVTRDNQNKIKSPQLKSVDVGLALLNFIPLTPFTHVFIDTFSNFSSPKPTRSFNCFQFISKLAQMSIEILSVNVYGYEYLCNVFRCISASICVPLKSLDNTSSNLSRYAKEKIFDWILCDEILQKLEMKSSHPPILVEALVDHFIAFTDVSIVFWKFNHENMDMKISHQEYTRDGILNCLLSILNSKSFTSEISVNESLINVDHVTVHFYLIHLILLKIKHYCNLIQTLSESNSKHKNLMVKCSWECLRFIFHPKTHHEVKCHGMPIFMTLLSFSVDHKNPQNNISSDFTCSIDFVINYLISEIEGTVRSFHHSERYSKIDKNRISDLFVCYLNVIQFVSIEMPTIQKDSISRHNNLRMLVHLIHRLFGILMNISKFSLFSQATKTTISFISLLFQNEIILADCQELQFLVDCSSQSNEEKTLGIKNILMSDPTYMIQILETSVIDSSMMESSIKFIDSIITCILCQTDRETLFQNLFVSAGLLKLVTGFKKLNYSFLSPHLNPLISWFLDKKKQIYSNKSLTDQDCSSISQKWWLEECGESISKFFSYPFIQNVGDSSINYSQNAQLLVNWCLDDTVCLKNGSNGVLLFAHMLLIKITHKFMESFCGSSKSQLIINMIDFISIPHSTKTVLRRSVINFVRKMPISATIFKEFLQKFTKLDFKSETYDSHQLYPIFTILDLLQAENCFINLDQIISDLYHLLQHLINHIKPDKNFRNLSKKPLENVGLENEEILIHSCLSAIANSFKIGISSRLPSVGITKMSRLASSKDGVRLGLVVDCLRSLKALATRSAALEVIAGVAEVWPKMVLEHVMPVFTFMGNFASLRDDKFSLELIEETIAKIVPALCMGGASELRASSRNSSSKLSSIHQRLSSNDENANDGCSPLNDDIKFDATLLIITSFAQTFSHVPEHRHLSLFKKLAESLGASEDSIAAIILILFDHQKDISDIEGVQFFCHSLIASHMLQLQQSVILQIINVCIELKTAIVSYFRSSSSISTNTCSNCTESSHVKLKKTDTSSSISKLSHHKSNPQMRRILQFFTFFRNGSFGGDKTNSEEDVKNIVIAEKFVIICFSFLAKHLQLSHDSPSSDHFENSHASDTQISIFESTTKFIELCTGGSCHLHHRGSIDKLEKTSLRKCFDFLQELTLALPHNQLIEIFNKLVDANKPPELQKRGLEVYVRWLSDSYVLSSIKNSFRRQFLRSCIERIYLLLESACDELAKIIDLYDSTQSSLSSVVNSEPQSSNSHINKIFLGVECTKPRKRRLSEICDDNSFSIIPMLNLVQFALFSLKTSMKHLTHKVTLQDVMVKKIFKLLFGKLNRQITRLEVGKYLERIAASANYDTSSLSHIDNLKVTMYLTLSELFVNSSSEIYLVYLSKFIKRMFGMLHKSSSNCENKIDYISSVSQIEAILLAFSKVFSTSPEYFGPYVSDCVKSFVKILILLHSNNLTDANLLLFYDSISSACLDEKRKQTATLTVSVLGKLSKTLNPSILLPQVTELLAHLRTQCTSSHESLMLSLHVVYVVDSHIEALKDPERKNSDNKEMILALSYIPEIVKSIISLQQNLQKHFEDFSSVDCVTFEEQTFPVLKKWLLMLNESDFKALFLTFYNDFISSCSDKKYKSIESSHSITVQISLYSLSLSLAQNMRSLSFLFFPILWNHIIQHIFAPDYSLTTEIYFESSQSIIQNVATKLCAVVCCYDENHFISLHNCDTFTDNIVSYLIHISSIRCDDERFRQIQSSMLADVCELIACLAGSLVSHLPNWQKLHEKLLRMCSRSCTSTKLAAIKTLTSFYARSGSDACRSTISDVIPIMSELLEDPSIDVERQTKNLLSTIQYSVGESIRAYF